jgi:uncharacterized iron-regulated membrane protein
MIKLARKYHKWLMLLVGLQFFIWGISGLYMVTMNIHYIHGESLLKTTQSSDELALENVNVDLNHIVTQYPSATNIELTKLLGNPIVKLTMGSNNIIILLDPETGKVVPNITSTIAKQIAKNKYAFNHDISSVQLIEFDPPAELAVRHLPVWQVNFDHFSNPTFYISKYSGQVVTKRHHYWRIFDWMWRFHIMDYDDGENVANWFLFVVALLGIISTFAGLILTYVHVIKKHRYAYKPTAPSTFGSFNKTIHKWVSLLVGAQLIIWLVTGLYFNLMDHTKASGNVNRQAVAHQPNESSAQLTDLSLYPVNKLNVTQVKSLELNWILNKPYYLINHDVSPHHYQINERTLYNATSGERVLINQSQINQIAQHSYKGAAIITSTELLKPPISELPNEHNQVWKISIEDELNTAIYIRDNSAQLISHVTDDKRLRDLMFKLHFMDYGNEGSFNNIQNIVFALFMLMLSLTGIYWLVSLVKNGQLKL